MCGAVGATDPQDSMNGNSAALTKHTVDCSAAGGFGTGNLSGFALQLDGAGASSHYDFTCCSGKGTGVDCRKDSTSYGPATGDVDDLLAHSVECRADEALSKFKLSKGARGARYKYSCCSAPGMNTCRQVTTKLSSDEGGDARGLSEHRLTCKEGELLRSFRLMQDPSGSQYVYSCCK